MRENTQEAERPRLGRPPRQSEPEEWQDLSFLKSRKNSSDTSASGRDSIPTEALVPSSSSQTNNVNNATGSTGRPNSNVGGNSSADSPVSDTAPSTNISVGVASSSGLTPSVQPSAVVNSNVGGKPRPIRSSRNANPVYK